MLTFFCAPGCCFGPIAETIRLCPIGRGRLIFQGRLYAGKPFGRCQPRILSVSGPYSSCPVPPPFANLGEGEGWAPTNPQHKPLNQTKLTSQGGGAERCLWQMQRGGSPVSKGALGRPLGADAARPLRTEGLACNGKNASARPICVKGAVHVVDWGIVAVTV